MTRPLSQVKYLIIAGIVAGCLLMLACGFFGLKAACRQPTSGRANELVTLKGSLKVTEVKGKVIAGEAPVTVAVAVAM